MRSDQTWGWGEGPPKNDPKKAQKNQKTMEKDKKA